MVGSWVRDYLNQEVSREKIGGVWIIRKNTEGLGVETSFYLN